jgi:hypothetical protein
MYQWAVFRFWYFFGAAVWGYGCGGEAAQVWMTMMQLNDDSIQSQKSEGQQQHTNGPAYDPNITSFDNAQTVKCTE